MKTLVVGNGGRESAIARELANSSTVYSCMSHQNPSIFHYVDKTGGQFKLCSVSDGEAISSFAVSHGIDMAVVSSDAPLAAGVVDHLKAANILTVGPTKKGAEIEWNKIFSRDLVEKLIPEINPWYKVARSKEDIEEIFQSIPFDEVAIKPVGLTGGKGVKVVGPHLKSLDEAKQYALECVANSANSETNGVIIEEKIDGKEFTFQCFTDGSTVVFPPLTFDYPYRYEGDTGPGTGGMGAVSLRDKRLPFVDDKAYKLAQRVVEATISELKKQNRSFNGVLNAGFFITKDNELKLIEFNARFGDPECMNILEILDSDCTSVMKMISKGSLEDLSFKDKASLVVYLVAPKYGQADEQELTFSVDVAAIKKHDVRANFSSAIQTSGNQYRSVGNSRILGLSTNDDSIETCREKILHCIKSYVKGDLEYRKDIGEI